METMNAFIPRSRKEAAESIRSVEGEHQDLRALSKREFLRVWKAFCFLEPGLHPDEYDNPDGGWSERWKPLAAEAFRRAEAGELADDELYPWMAALKGVELLR